MGGRRTMNEIEEQFSELYDAIFRYCRVRMNTTQEAEDVTQNVFAKAVTSAATYNRSKGNIQQWLIGIARNAIIDYWKKQSSDIDLESIPEIAERSVDAEGVDAQLLYEKIYASLKPGQQQLLHMRYVDDMTYEEIAKAVGKQPAAVRMFFSRLKKQLHTYDEEAA